MRLAPVLLLRLAMRARGRRRGPGEAGLALAIALFTLMGFLVATTPSTRVAGVDIVATRNARGTNRMYFVAESPHRIHGASMATVANPFKPIRIRSQRT